MQYSNHCPLCNTLLIRPTISYHDSDVYEYCNSCSIYDQYSKNYSLTYIIIRYPIYNLYIDITSNIVELFKHVSHNKLELLISFPYQNSFIQNINLHQTNKEDLLFRILKLIPFL